jgi:hypothetical protein
VPALEATPGDVSTALETVAQNPPPAALPPAAEGALKQVTVDVSATVGDLTTTTVSGIGTTVSNTTPESQGISSVVQASGIIRIIFRRP